MNTDPSTLSEQQRLVEEHLHTEWVLHDVEAITATFIQSEEARFDAVPFGMSLPPSAAYTMLLTAVPDLTGTVTASFDLPGVSIRELTLTGTHSGPYLDIEATGRTVTFEVAALFFFEERDSEVVLMSERVYYDNNTILQELTAADPDAVPTGVGLVERAGGEIAGAAETEDPDAVLAAQRAIVSEHLSLENEHDWTTLSATWPEDDGFFDAVPLSAHLVGQDGAAGAYAMLSTALPDMAVEVIERFDVPGWSVREIVITGTHLGEYMGIPATGNPIRFQAICFFPFAVSAAAAVTFLGERVYFDNLTVLSQMQTSGEE